MDFHTFFTVILSCLSSGLVGLAAARWLTKRLIDHRLTKDLKDYQASLDDKLATSKAHLDQNLKDYQATLDAGLAASKAQVEASLRQKVEDYLGDKAAERAYQLDARKRLYTAIGPLRVQLVKACADLAARVDRIGNGQRFPISLDGYYGQSTIFRLLRIFAISELIERQMAYADFSVDVSMAGLLRFKHAAFLCLSSSTVSLDHPNTNWNSQVEHVFYDRLSVIAAALVVFDGDKNQQPRVMRFDEFNKLVSNPELPAAIDPIPQILKDFSIDKTPVFWIRLVALGQLCSTFAKREGPAMGIASDPYDGEKMLRASSDKFLQTNFNRYAEAIGKLCATVAETVK
jgi:hypothetical protein